MARKKWRGGGGGRERERERDREWKGGADGKYLCERMAS